MLSSPRGPSCGRQSPGILKKAARYGGSHGVYPNIHVKSMDSCHNRRNKKEHRMSMYPLIMHMGMQDLVVSEPVEHHGSGPPLLV